MPQHIIIANDHAGFHMKQSIIEYLQSKNITATNLGSNNTQHTDYPLYAHKLAKEIINNPEAIGILICGSGIGMAMAINKHPTLRGAACYNNEHATLARQHNNAQVLCLGARSTNQSAIIEIVKTFLNTGFENKERHNRRIKQIPVTHYE